MEHVATPHTNWVGQSGGRYRAIASPPLDICTYIIGYLRRSVLPPSHPSTPWPLTFDTVPFAMSSSQNRRPPPSINVGSSEAPRTQGQSSNTAAGGSQQQPLPSTPTLNDDGVPLVPRDIDSDEGGNQTTFTFTPSLSNESTDAASFALTGSLAEGSSTRATTPGRERSSASGSVSMR